MRKVWQTPTLGEVPVRSALFGSAQSEVASNGPTLGPLGPTGLQFGPQPGPFYGPPPGPQPGPFYGPPPGPQPGPLMGPPVPGPAFFGPGGSAPGPLADMPLYGPGLYGPGLSGPNGPSLFGPPVPSDARLKENMRRIGTTVQGLPLYTFSYRGQAQVYEGVIAQDVLAVRPDAVVMGEDGYYKVDYAKLGVPFRRVH